MTFSCFEQNIFQFYFFYLDYPLFMYNFVLGSSPVRLSLAQPRQVRKEAAVGKFSGCYGQLGPFLLKN